MFSEHMLHLLANAFNKKKRKIAHISECFFPLAFATYSPPLK